MCVKISLTFFFWLQLWKTKKTNTISKFKNSPGNKCKKLLSSFWLIFDDESKQHFSMTIKTLILQQNCIPLLQMCYDVAHSGSVRRFQILGGQQKKGHLWGRNIPMFFISRVSSGALSIDAKRHIWFTGRASIFSFLLLLLYYWALCCEIFQLNFSLKYYSKGT